MGHSNLVVHLTMVPNESGTEITIHHFLDGHSLITAQVSRFDPKVTPFDTLSTLSTPNTFDHTCF